MQPPSIEKARRIVQNPDAVEWVTLVETAGILAHSSEAAFDDLIALLKIKGLPREWAAIALYKKTNRPSIGSEDFIVDFEDWTNYLKKGNFI
jgi:hypothetical protein